MSFWKKYQRLVGPGIITGAADNDPSGIATYSQAGAQFGYGLLWTGLYMLPLQTAVQDACARIGFVKGEGIASVLRKYYPRHILFFLMGLLFIANVINIGANIGAMVAAIQLMVAVNFSLCATIVTLGILILQIFIPYRHYAKILKGFCLFLLAYPITIFFIHAPVLTILKMTFIPHIQLNGAFFFILTGLLGTTISPYLFFWESSQQVEEKKLDKSYKYNMKKKIYYIRLENLIGMIFSQLCAWAIMLVAGTVLYPAGVTHINTAADAAKSLVPLVGPWAEIIFAIGIIGLGLLSVPVLAASVAYGFSETFQYKASLNDKFHKALFFYGVIILATLVGLGLNFIGINPMHALIYAAVLNGIVAVPLIVMLAIVARSKKIMGEYRSDTLTHGLICFTFVCMFISALFTIFHLF